MTPPAGTDERLELYARYAALAAEQETALDAEDFDRFRELSAERDRMREEIRSAPGSAADDRERARILAPALEIERRMHEKLRVLRRDTVRQLRSLERGAGGQRTYARTMSAGRRGADLDVRY